MSLTEYVTYNINPSYRRHINKVSIYATNPSYRRHINKVSIYVTIINMGRIHSLVHVHKNRDSHTGVHTINNEELIACNKRAQCRIEKPVDFELINFEQINFKDLVNQKIDGFYLTIYDISRLQEIYKEISSNTNK